MTDTILHTTTYRGFTLLIYKDHVKIMRGGSLWREVNSPWGAHVAIDEELSP